MKIYLDLLPEARKKMLRRKKKFRIILEQEFLLLFPLLVFIVILANIFLLLNFKKDSIAQGQLQQGVQGQYQELDGYENDIKDMNKKVDEVSKINDAHLVWSRAITRLEKDVPQGIVINDLSTKDYKILLVGKSATRESLINFKENIQSDDCFQEPNVPLSNLVTKENIEFQMDFSVKEACLIKK